MREITAKQDRCGDSLTCPAVFEDGGKIVIIGKAARLPELAHRVGPGEVAIEIDRGIVSRALAVMNPMAKARGFHCEGPVKNDDAP